MKIGRIEWEGWEIQDIRLYLLAGLTGKVDGKMVPDGHIVWPNSHRLAVAVNGSLRILQTSDSDYMEWHYPYLGMPQVPLSDNILPLNCTAWLQVAIWVAEQLGLTNDPEVMKAIESRLTEEVLEGRATADDGPQAARSEGGEELRKFAWSKQGQLAAEIRGQWRLPNGELVNVDDSWAFMAL